MTVLTICNHKGGTGKTTSAIHIAAGLGLSGYRVLVIDLDPQSFLTRALGVEEPEQVRSSLMLFQDEVPLGEVEPISLKGFDLLPSSSVLTKLMRRLNKPTDVFWAKEAIRNGLDYDIVLFDTAAAITVYSLNALVASQYVVIPVTPEYQPVIGAEQTYQTATMVKERLNPELHLPLFLFTQVDARKRNHHRYRRYFRKRYSDQVMETVIRTNASLATSYSDGTTVFEHDPYSRGARDYANATDELLTHINATQAASTRQDEGEEPALDAAQDRPARENPTHEDSGDVDSTLEESAREVREWAEETSRESQPEPHHTLPTNDVPAKDTHDDLSEFNNRSDLNA